MISVTYLVFRVKKILVILLSVMSMWALAQEQDSIVSWQDNDSVVMAPLHVQGVGVDNYEGLSSPKSSLDLKNPDNVTTAVEYDAAQGCYVVHTRIGDVDIATPYMMTMDEYRAYSEREQMSKYWQTKIGEVEHDNERKFDITDMKFNIGPEIRCLVLVAYN